MSANLPARRRADVARGGAWGVPAFGAGQHTVPGSQIPILTVKVVSYGGQTREAAHQQVWWDWTCRYPGALIQTVEGDDWEVLW